MDAFKTQKKDIKLLPIWYQLTKVHKETSRNRIQLLCVAEQLILSY